MASDAKACFSSKVEYRTVIWFLYLNGKTGKEIYGEMCKKVRDLVYSDRRSQVEEIAQALGISHGSVSTILHDR